MKKEIHLLLMSLLLLFTSCDKYDSGIEDPEIYKNVYMPRAARDSTVLSVTRDVASFELDYSAYLGGVDEAAGDISVSFKVDEEAGAAFNAKYGTNYPLLPAANYTLGTTAAVIKSGTRSTEKLPLTVKSGEDLALFKTYILPVSIESVAGSASKILPKYATTYYLIKVGQEELVNLGSNWGGVFSLGPKNTLVTNDKNSKDILMYLPDEAGKYKETPLHIGIKWDASEQFFYVNENSMVVRNVPPYAGLFNFIMHPENIIQSNTTPTNIITNATNFWLGDKWNRYILVPWYNYFLTLDNDGTLWRQPAYTFVDQNRSSMATELSYTQVVPFPSANPNALICLNVAGDLWYYPTGVDGKPGIGKKVGSGWNVFKKMIVRGNNILALSGSNGVYAIPFDPAKTYFF